MAFTLRIWAKGLFQSRKNNFEKLINTILETCELGYGSNGEFFILQEGKIEGQSVILYNPKCIGRGIYLDGQAARKGILEVSYNIPTTATEIEDFLMLVRDICELYKKVSLYCIEEEREYTLEELVAKKDELVQFSLESLNNFCSNKEYVDYLLTLAKWPWNIPEELVTYFASCRDLKLFEETIHKLQDRDAYYAKPSLMQDQKDGKIAAFYVLTSECTSIFPIKADGFINMDNLQIDQGLVRFYLYDENRLCDEICEYDEFIQYVMSQGAQLYDKRHIYIPPYSKKQIEEMIQSIYYKH